MFRTGKSFMAPSKAKEIAEKMPESEKELPATPASGARYAGYVQQMYPSTHAMGLSGLGSYVPYDPPSFGISTYATATPTVTGSWSNPSTGVWAVSNTGPTTQTVTIMIPAGCSALISIR